MFGEFNLLKTTVNQSLPFCGSPILALFSWDQGSGCTETVWGGGYERTGIEKLHLDVLYLGLIREHGSGHFRRSIMVLNNQFILQHFEGWYHLSGTFCEALAVLHTASLVVISDVTKKSKGIVRWKLNFIVLIYEDCELMRCQLQKNRFWFQLLCKEIIHSCL